MIDPVVQDSDHDLLTRHRRQRAHAKVDLPALHDRTDAAVLGDTTLGDVQVRHDLQATADRRGHRVGRAHGAEQNAVDAVPHLELLLLGLDVDVAGTLLDRVGDQVVHEADDRRLAAGLLEVVGILGLLLDDAHVVLGHFADDVVQVAEIAATFAVELLAGLGDERRRDDARDDFAIDEPTLGLVEQKDVCRVAQAELNGLAVVGQRDDVTGLAEVDRQPIDDLTDGVVVGRAGIDVRHFVKIRQRLVDGRFVRTGLDEHAFECAPRTLGKHRLRLLDDVAGNAAMQQIFESSPGLLALVGLPKPAEGGGRFRRRVEAKVRHGSWSGGDAIGRKRLSIEPGNGFVIVAAKRHAFAGDGGDGHAVDDVADLEELAVDLACGPTSEQNGPDVRAPARPWPALRRLRDEGVHARPPGDGRRPR